MRKRMYGLWSPQEDPRVREFSYLTSFPKYQSGKIIQYNLDYLGWQLHRPKIYHGPSSDRREEIWLENLCIGDKLLSPDCVLV